MAEHENALDAINEALGLEAEEPKDELETDIEETGDEESGDDAGADGEGDDTGDDGEGAEGDEEAEGDEDGEPDEEGEPTDAAKAAAKAAGKPVSEFNADGTPKKPEAKKPDPINDPIPKDLKKETSDRMRTLIKMNKEKEAELTQVSSNFDTIINGIKASGSTPEQYGEAISWLSLFNSPKPEDRRAAYELVENVADRMATLLGIDRAVADPLKGHQDLIDAVKTGKATMEIAKEVARTRNAQGFNRQIADGQRQQQQTQEQAKQEHETAKSELNAFDAKMREEDPLYAAKRKVIVPILQPIFKTLPKSQWAAAYKNAYAQAKVQPTGRNRPGAAKPGAQPLRGNKQPAGGRTREPTSALDAMNGALLGMKN